MPKIIVEVPENCLGCKFRSRIKKVSRYCLLFEKHLEDLGGGDKPVTGLRRCKECKDAEVTEKK